MTPPVINPDSHSASAIEALHPAAEFLYSPLLLTLFDALQHAGVLSNATAAVTVGNVSEGARVTLQVMVQQQQLTMLRYQAYGCPYLLAGCEWLARQLQGQPVALLSQVEVLSLEALLHAPPDKRARWLLLEDAVRQLAQTLR